MNKTELISKVAESTDVPKHYVEIVTDSLFESISRSVAVGEIVKVRNFGTFTTVRKSSRTGVNPRTKEPLEIPAHTAIRFVAGKDFKAEVNG
jgi:DNA-binding protein HU-beta